MGCYTVWQTAAKLLVTLERTSFVLDLSGQKATPLNDLNTIDLDVKPQLNPADDK